jgi:hypothetical protein
MTELIIKQKKLKNNKKVSKFSLGAPMDDKGDHIASNFHIKRI